MAQTQKLKVDKKKSREKMRGRYGDEGLKEVEKLRSVAPKLRAVAF